MKTQGISKRKKSAKILTEIFRRYYFKAMFIFRKNKQTYFKQVLN